VIPFLHIGSLEIPTFGLMVAMAMLSAYWLLSRDISRRNLSAQVDPELFVAVPSLAGIVGAKLYHVLENPSELFAHPAAAIFSQFGFAWFGGLIAGVATFLWLGWRRRIPLLLLLDIGSPAAAVGYGVGRIGCFLSGDGDYGIPTSLPWGMSFPNGLVPTTQHVHPTPIYEFIAACLAAWFLWGLGRSGCQIQHKAAPVSPTEQRAGYSLAVELPEQRPRSCGVVFAFYLLTTGLARFLVEFIRINPRSFFGLTNAQTASVLSVIAGGILLLRLRSRNKEAA